MESRIERLSKAYAETYDEEDLMRKSIEYAIGEAKREGLSEGVEQNKLEIAKNLLNLNMPINDIEKATGLSKEVILALKND